MVKQAEKNLYWHKIFIASILYHSQKNIMSTTNLAAGEGIEKMKELAEGIDICLFCTNLKTGDGATTRPMSVQEVDEDGNLWFFSDINSDKNREIVKDKRV